LLTSSSTRSVSEHTTDCCSPAQQHFFTDDIALCIESLASIMLHLSAGHPCCPQFCPDNRYFAMLVLSLSSISVFCQPHSDGCLFMLLKQSWCACFIRLFTTTTLASGGMHLASCLGGTCILYGGSTNCILHGGTHLASG